MSIKQEHLALPDIYAKVPSTEDIIGVKDDI